MSITAVITLDHDHLGRVDRKQALAAFADDLYIEPVFGPDRPLVAASLVAHVRGIMPTKADVLRNAFGYGNERRIRAYKNGARVSPCGLLGIRGDRRAPLPGLRRPSRG